MNTWFQFLLIAPFSAWLASKIVGLKRFLAICMYIGFIEQMWFILNCGFNLNLYEVVNNSLSNYVVLATDIDIIMMTILALVFIVDASVDSDIDTTVLLFSLCTGGHNLVWLCIFYSLTSEDNKLVRFKAHNRFRDGLFLGLLNIIPFFVAFRNADPITSFETLHRAFTVDPVHCHHFFIIFIGALYLIPVITNMNIHILWRVALILVAIVNISAGYFFILLWLYKVDRRPAPIIVATH